MKNVLLLINFAKIIPHLEKVRQIKLFKSYYKDFYVTQTDVVRDKINYVLRLVETQRVIPKKFCQHTQGQDDNYRLTLVCVMALR